MWRFQIYELSPGRACPQFFFKFPSLLLSGSTSTQLKTDGTPATTRRVLARNWLRHAAPSSDRCAATDKCIYSNPTTNSIYTGSSCSVFPCIACVQTTLMCTQYEDTSVQAFVFFLAQVLQYAACVELNCADPGFVAQVEAVICCSTKFIDTLTIANTCSVSNRGPSLRKELRQAVFVSVWMDSPERLFHTTHICFC